ncbi:Protein of unknown function [Daejeonella rubra]|uniref:DUF2752 domain-containing protein n=1 Tax=Daejeonella rubra TaxID=990371 RepID=A0A1G9RQR9_9SPHI|nr:DUF2752 domain-containing protein [Daejeonella rubra]SDM25307.1 Protein of unknown function [Daejeonella rubra]
MALIFQKNQMLKKLPVELIVWLGALLFLTFTETSGSSHSSLCPLDNLGFSWCPGCGLGRSIRYMLHGDPVLSFGQHWFGIPALMILIYRIMQLLNNFLLNLDITKQFQHGKRPTS